MEIKKEEKPAHLKKKYGKYHVGDNCENLCQACLTLAPKNLGEVDGKIVVIKQPENDQEERQIQEAMVSCPFETIQKDE